MGSTFGDVGEIGRNTFNQVKQILTVWRRDEFLTFKVKNNIFALIPIL